MEIEVNGGITRVFEDKKGDMRNDNIQACFGEIAALENHPKVILVQNSDPGKNVLEDSVEQGVTDLDQLLMLMTAQKERRLKEDREASLRKATIEEKRAMEDRKIVEMLTNRKNAVASKVGEPGISARANLSKAAGTQTMQRQTGGVSETCNRQADMYARPICPEAREDLQSLSTSTTQAVSIFPMRGNIIEGSSDDESGGFAQSREPSDGLEFKQENAAEASMAMPDSGRESHCGHMVNGFEIQDPGVVVQHQATYNEYAPQSEVQDSYTQGKVLSFAVLRPGSESCDSDALFSENDCGTGQVQGM